MQDYIMQMEHITKRFSGVIALDDVNFQVRRGEIHALVGENGAGKSTLMKILSGVYSNREYEGKLLVNGEEQSFRNTRDAEKTGIAIIHQELNMIKTMDICENIFIGNEIKKNNVIQWNEQYRRTIELMKRVKLTGSPTTKVGELGVGKQQLVEIAKALNKNAKLIILDEPTASLTEIEVEILMDILQQLKREGTTCIYISHKLEEVFNIADRVTVLRDGKTIVTKDIGDVDEETIISNMVGRELTEHFPYVKHTQGEKVLETKNWTVMNPEIIGRKLLDGINIEVYRGEILGIAGLMGAGRTEFAMSFFGCLTPTNDSELVVKGESIKIKNPRQAIESGIGYVSEDRKRYGLVLRQNIKKNMSLASMDSMARFGAINKNLEITTAQQYVNDLRIKARNIDQTAETLSGGNQQKVILSKWILTKPDILILDEPTRGIDVGAKFEIYQIMNKLAKQGVAIIMISSELPEILGMSNRIYVMHEGKINGEFSHDEATQEKILACAAGG